MIRTLLAVLLLPLPARAQGTIADYERANSLRQRFENKITHDRVQPRWTEDGNTFWYKNGSEFVLVDAVAGTRTVVGETDLPKGAKEATAEPPRRGNRPQFPPAAATSPDKKRLAFVKDRNVWLRDTETKEETKLSSDGTEGDGYDSNFHWSPDSTKLLAVRIKDGGDRRVTLVESSPANQVQPKVVTYPYLKPGDAIPTPKPHLFDVVKKAEIPVRDKLFPTPWDISSYRWEADSSRVTFTYNQRGHGVMRVIAVDAATGEATALVNEECKTFFDYTNKLYLRHLPKTGELIWMSERSGWNHLYLVDAKTGDVKNPITQGDWVVRRVERIDEEQRQVWVQIMGYHSGQDPYHIHLARVNFDGTGFFVVTAGDGTHATQWSPDRRFLIDTYSRVDLPPRSDLRSAEGKFVCHLETADVSALKDWPQPSRFTAPGRDEQTSIHGYVVRPSHYDPTKKYRVIEHIYAGPHDHFVTKAFRPVQYEQAIAELGFIVVKIDGMGTNWRSKAFHDVCWKNIGDAGLPDRIAWIQAAAVKFPEMDIADGVGIFGGSAGGQSTVRAMTEYPDFYTVGVSDCGCHDNRMDKIWWNEMWMGWPVGPHYAAQSNVTNAHKVTGKLLLVVGEKDSNVDPASTMQVANALIKADRDFELLVIPGANHGAAETPYGKRRRADFFVRNMLGVEPRRR